MNRFILIFFAALALGACGDGADGNRPSTGQEEAGRQKYTCPMHPHYISDEGGTCPICGMDLVPVEADASDAATIGGSAPKGERKILYYKHPMGLPDTSPGPKKDSMGMDYLPVYEKEAADAAGVISVPPETIQTMGVRTAPVEMTSFGRTVRAFGAVEANTRLQSAISARVEGWIDGLATTAVGDEVKKGDLLFRLYSPDLIAAQQDFLVAVRSGSEGRVASASRRLVSLGLQEQTIAALRQRGQAEERAPVYAAHDGIVSALNVREGAFVKPGDRIALLQGYSEVWVMTSIAEQDLGEIKSGQPVGVAFPNIPNADRRGVVDYIYPTVDPRTRTGKVRIVLANEDDLLKPGAYADVMFAVDARARLAVPSEAVLRDSRGAHVIVALGDGRFAPRPVETGVAAMGKTEIVSGLQEADEIVVSGQFLIDSESSLRESFGKMRAPDNAAPMSMSGEEANGEALSLMDHIVDAALYLREALVDGFAPQPSFFDPALAAGKTLKTRYGEAPPGASVETVVAALQRVKAATTDENRRGALGGLVEALRPLLNGNAEHYREAGVVLFLDNSTGRLWLQQGETPANPYGEGEAQMIPWPDVMDGMNMNGMPAERNDDDSPRNGGGRL